MELNDIIKLIQKRDGISYNEAVNCVKECQEEINYILENNPTYDAVADCVRDYLSLQPDYIEVLLPL